VLAILQVMQYATGHNYIITIFCLNNYLIHCVSQQMTVFTEQIGVVNIQFRLQ